MRLVVLIAGLMLAANTMAEEKPKTVTKQLDKSSPQLMSTDSGNDSNREVVSPRDAASGLPTGKRQHAPAPGDGGDYNSSRSNKTHTPAAPTCGNGVDNDCDDVVDDRAAPANQNTTRSNRTLRATPPSNKGSTGQARSAADGGSSSSGGTRAQDYNSSRSNTTSRSATASTARCSSSRRRRRTWPRR